MRKKSGANAFVNSDRHFSWRSEFVLTSIPITNILPSPQVIGFCNVIENPVAAADAYNL